MSNKIYVFTVEMISQNKEEIPENKVCWYENTSIKKALEDLKTEMDNNPYKIISMYNEEEL